MKTKNLRCAGSVLLGSLAFAAPAVAVVYPQAKSQTSTFGSKLRVEGPASITGEQITLHVTLHVGTKADVVFDMGKVHPTKFADVKVRVFGEGAKPHSLGTLKPGAVVKKTYSYPSLSEDNYCKDGKLTSSIFQTAAVDILARPIVDGHKTQQVVLGVVDPRLPIEDSVCPQQ